MRLAKSLFFLLILPLSIVPAATAAVPTRADVLIVTAVDYEYRAVSSLLKSPQHSILAAREVSDGSYDGGRVVVIRSGWGKAQAAGAAAMAIRAFAPRMVVMAGVAGGIDAASVNSGDVVVVQRAFQYDLGQLSHGQVEMWPAETPRETPYPSPEFESAEDLVGAALAAGGRVQFDPWKLPPSCACERDGKPKPGCAEAPVQIDRAQPRVCAGTVATGDAFLEDPDVSRRLVATHHAVAADMETAAVAEEAANSGIPFVGIRLVADMVNGSNQNLYYCLKPFLGPRLHDVMAAVLSNLLKPPEHFRRVTASDSCRKPE